MDEQLKQSIGKYLEDLYGVDINDGVIHFSTQNYAIIFPGSPYMIRISMTPRKSRQEIVSELMWVDDLKQFKQTICEPNISKKGRLLEEFEIDGVTYRTSMFRTARGNVQEVVNFTPMFFVCVGDLLGTIHHVSTEERSLGMHYKRRTQLEQFREQKEVAWDRLSPEIQERVSAVEKAVSELPDTLGTYGLCHGDFHANNFFVEANNVWLFDFDGCCYANYLYDIASFISSSFLQGFGFGRDARTVLEEELLPHFRYGYELNHKLPEELWDLLPLFLAYRVAYTVLMLAMIENYGLGDIQQMKQYFNDLLLADNILNGITAANARAAAAAV
ncbi:MAG: phosphotransferase, partial [Clostridia bacterium]|nr:phosphotransferase [Clostridia bacterium]